ncbi:MAG TPA: hypothetical protein VGL38_15370 [bacterium]|jgi:hypothetical protein
MLHRTKVLLAVILAIFLGTSFWGCNRLGDGLSENRAPEVHFVNIPLDSTTFSYAPVVRWYGYDADGLVNAFQYHDAGDTAAVNAYRAGDAALQQYINSLPASAWVTTYSNADTVYLRRAADTTITEHVFMLRCVDDKGAFSSVKVRTFFRTNNPPYAPSVKWALDVTRTSPDRPQDYQLHYDIPDTLFWGDTLTSTYPGIGFLWKGSDPDSRALNVIPLTYSYMLQNETTGEIFPYAIRDDSNHVVGYAQGWSPWSSEAQVTFAAAAAFAVDPNFQLDGSYKFYLKVRDDGLTESTPDSVCWATFRAVSAVEGRNFDRQLLVVDWTAHPTAGIDSTNFGMRNDQEITDFYNAVIPEGLALAEQWRALNPLANPTPIPNQYDWYLDKDFTLNNRVPIDHIRHYKWVWVISDNLSRNAPTDIQSRVKVLQEYMKVGGQVLFSGRGVFRDFGLTQCGDLVPTASNWADRHFRDYHNLSTVCAKGQQATNMSQAADFGGATTTDRLLPGLEVDTALVHRMIYHSQRYYCLPEVDYFGRSGAASGTEYTVSLYNYNSCSSLASDSAFNVDCMVVSSTPSRANLRPAAGHTRILNVSRVFNATRGVAGEVIAVDREILPSGLPGEWRIVVSTPATAGAWQDSDSLQVDYTYIPIQPSHDQPVATNYIRYQSVITYNRDQGRFNIELWTRFRSGLFTFPLSFIKNDYVPEMGGTKVAAVIAYEALFFNQPRVFSTNFGGGRPNP